MTSDYLQKEIAQRQSRRVAKIEDLELEIAAAKDDDSEVDEETVDRLDRLMSVNGTQDAEEVLAEHTIKIALHSISRREAFQRSQLQVQAREWLKEQSGAEKYEDINIKELDDSIGSVWMAMFQAADIIPALDVSKCEGWKVPTTLEGWADVNDFIYTKILAETWALNPQFTLMHQLSGGN
jgi:hypothetical protein